MKKFQIKKKCILALGAESIGIFAVFKDGDIFISDNFGDLFDENNFLKYKKAVLSYLGREKIKPVAILTDLHPLFRTTLLGEELAKKYEVKHIKIQHHIAHIFSAVGDCFCRPELARLDSTFESKRVSGSAKHRFRNKTCPVLVSGFGMTDNYQLPANFFGLAMDGTGYGLDGNIWGGEVFRIQIPNPKSQIPNKSQTTNPKIEIQRIGSLEEQIMIGGDLAVREPARMLIAILAKLKVQNSKFKTKTKNLKLIKSKNDIYDFVKKFYTKNEFEMLYNQLGQNFNCQKTTSTGRILDAVSVLLGFAGNERNYKHEATKKLEKNSSEPYEDLTPKISFSVIASSPSADGERGNLEDSVTNTGLLRRFDDYIETSRNDNRKILQATPLFEYLIKNIKKDKRRLAATVQLYIAKGLHKIIQLQTKDCRPKTIFAAGGLANNKIISKYLEKQGVYLAKKIPRGDEGIAFGQIVHYLLNNF